LHADAVSGEITFGESQSDGRSVPISNGDALQESFKDGESLKQSVPDENAYNNAVADVFSIANTVAHKVALYVSVPEFLEVEIAITNPFADTNGDGVEESISNGVEDTDGDGFEFSISNEVENSDANEIDDAEPDIVNFAHCAVVAGGYAKTDCNRDRLARVRGVGAPARVASSASDWRS
jgi:hypothetical protein